MSAGAVRTDEPGKNGETETDARVVPILKPSVRFSTGGLRVHAVPRRFGE